MRDLTLNAPVILRQLSDTNRVLHSITCLECGRLGWPSPDLNEAISHWDRAMQSESNAIHALTHSEMLLIGKNQGRKWGLTIALVIAWLVFMYFIGQYVFWG